MKGIGYTKLLVAFFAASLLVFLAAEQFDFLRSDSIAAIACTRELLTGKPDVSAVVIQYRDPMEESARRHDLPPEFLAAIIFGHQRGLTPSRKFTDCAASALGGNLSLGLAQVRISTAAATDKLELKDLSPAMFKTYRTALLDPVQNIEYQSRELRGLADRDNRFPGITAEALIHDPFKMALLMSEYRMGPQQAQGNASKLSNNAFFDLSQMMTENLYVFGRDAADAMQVRAAVTEYLEYINCDSGIFNARACDQWRARINLEGEHSPGAPKGSH